MKDETPQPLPEGCLLQALTVVFWFSTWWVIYLTLAMVLDYTVVDSFHVGWGFLTMAIAGVAVVLLVKRFGRVNVWLRTVVVIALVVGLSVAVTVVWLGLRPVSVDNPVGTLQLDKLSADFATDPDGVAERIVGKVWRIEGPKRAFTQFEGQVLFADVGTDHAGVTTLLEPTFVDEWDELRFKTRVIPIACRIVKVNGPPAVQSITLYAPSHLDDERWIEADSCRVIDPAKSQ